MQDLVCDIEETSVLVDAGPVQVVGELTMPRTPRGVVALVEGLGPTRSSGRDRALAATLAREGFGTLICNPYDADEVALDRLIRHLRFDRGSLVERTAAIVSWLRRRNRCARLPIGLVGTGTGAAAAIIAAPRAGELLGVVACGARTELPRDTREQVQCPVLFVAGARDGFVVASHCRAARLLAAPTTTHLVTGTASLDNPAAAGKVAEVIGAWFGGCVERRAAAAQASLPHAWAA